MREQLIRNHFLSAQQLFKIGDLDRAEAQVKQALTLDPNHEPSLLLVANIHLRKKAFPQAEQFLLRALRNNPTQVEALSLYGKLLLAMNRFVEAEEVFRKALAFGGGDRGEIYYQLGLLAQREKRLGEAQQYFRQALAEKPHATEVILALIRILEDIGQKAEVQDLVAEGLRRDPRHPQLLYLAGTSALQRGDYSSAAAHLEEAVKVRPDWVEALNALGVALLHLGRRAEARLFYQEVNRLDPGNADAAVNLALLLGEEGERDRAIALLRDVVQRDPRHPRASLTLARFLHEAGNTQEALAIVEKVLEQNPNDPEARNDAGRYRYWLGDYAHSEQDLLFSLNHRGDDPETLRLLGNLYMRTGRENLVPKVQQRIERSRPGWFELWRDLALHLQQTRRLEKAREVMEHYLKNKPDDREAAFLLAEWCLEAQDWPRAREILEKLLEQRREPRLLNDLAQAYRGLGAHQKALEITEELLRLQGQAGAGGEDFLETLQMYEGAVQDITQDLEDNWRSNLKALRQGEMASAPATTPAPAEEVGPGEDPEWATLPVEDEGLSLLEMPDLNPAIVIDEAEETLRIYDEDEILHYEGDEDDEEKETLVVQGGGSERGGDTERGGTGRVGTPPQSGGGMDTPAVSPSMAGGGDRPEVGGPTVGAPFSPTSPRPEPSLHQKASTARETSPIEALLGEQHTPPQPSIPPPSMSPPPPPREAPSWPTEQAQPWSKPPPPPRPIQPPSPPPTPMPSPQATPAFSPPPAAMTSWPNPPVAPQPAPSAWPSSHASPAWPQGPMTAPPTYPEAPSPPGPPAWPAAAPPPRPVEPPQARPQAGPRPPQEMAPPQARDSGAFPTAPPQAPRASPLVFPPPRLIPRSPTRPQPEPRPAKPSVPEAPPPAWEQPEAQEPNRENGITEPLPPPVTEKDLEDGLEALLDQSGLEDVSLEDEFLDDWGETLESLDLEEGWGQEEGGEGTPPKERGIEEDTQAEQPSGRKAAAAEGEAPPPEAAEGQSQLVDVVPEHFSDELREEDVSETLEGLIPGPSPKKTLVPTTERIAQLMDYLGQLTNYLPPEKKLQLMHDQIPLKIERIKLNLKAKSIPQPESGAAAARRKVRELIDKVRENLK